MSSFTFSDALRSTGYHLSLVNQLHFTLRHTLRSTASTAPTGYSILGRCQDNVQTVKLSKAPTPSRHPLAALAVVKRDDDTSQALQCGALLCPLVVLPALLAQLLQGGKDVVIQHLRQYKSEKDSVVRGTLTGMSPDISLALTWFGNVKQRPAMSILAADTLRWCADTRQPHVLVTATCGELT